MEAELISALGMGTNLDVAAADQSRPSETRAAKLIHPMRRIFIPHLGKMGLAYFSPSECEVAHTSRALTVVIKLRPARAATEKAAGGLFWPDPRSLGFSRGLAGGSRYTKNLSSKQAFIGTGETNDPLTLACP
jgi:hypothetical protein